MNCFDIMARAVDIYENRDNYAYYYGARNQILTDEVMHNLEAAYPDYFKQYDKYELEVIHDYSRGKVGLDCSAFIDVITGQSNYSTGYYESGLNKTTPVAGTWGNMLYTTFGGKGRHIGLDMGAGRFLHMPKEGRTLELGVIKDYEWEGSAQFPGVSYTLTSNR